MSRTIRVLAEGMTERAAVARLKRFLDDKAGSRPKVRLVITKFDGCLREKDVRTRADIALEDADLVGLVTLSDVYPSYPDADVARQTVRSWLPPDPRCHSCAALHDFEAWLLCDWKAILKHVGIPNRQPWGANPEEVDRLHPPAHRLQGLFQTRRKRYIKPVDGKKLFDQLDLDRAAAKCGELERFLNALLTCAGYPLLARSPPR